MDEEEPRRKPTKHEIGELLDTLSVEELRLRIELLRAEIARLETAIDAKQASRHAADTFFKR
jgi:uncharacterized small protein (DUF1192 family)